MASYIARRLVYSILLLILASTAIFFILNSTPGTPIDRMLSEMANRNPQKLQNIPESHWEQLLSLFGFDKPIQDRFLEWVRNILSGHFGTSWSIGSGSDVFAFIGTRLPFTLTLMISATLFSLMVAIPFGIYSAIRPYSDGDIFVTIFSFFGMAMPNFWVGLILISLFRFTLDWLPASGGFSIGYPGNMFDVLNRIFTMGTTHPEVAGMESEIFADGIKHLILPTITLSLYLIARWSRFVRTAMLEVIHMEYIRTAWAKGLSEWGIIIRHVLRAGLVPLITVITLDFPKLFTGTFIIEIVFSWPGIGRIYIDGLKSADWPLLQGLLMINAVMYVGANFLADILSAVIDPQIKLSAIGN